MYFHSFDFKLGWRPCTTRLSKEVKSTFPVRMVGTWAHIPTVVMSGCSCLYSFDQWCRGRLQVSFREDPIQAVSTQPPRLPNGTTPCVQCLVDRYLVVLSLVLQNDDSSIETPTRIS
jgi:hypothetical protein